jgi:hypothetical protein
MLHDRTREGESNASKKEIFIDINANDREINLPYTCDILGQFQMNSPANSGILEALKRIKT